MLIKHLYWFPLEFEGGSDHVSVGGPELPAQCHRPRELELLQPELPPVADELPERGLGHILVPAQGADLLASLAQLVRQLLEVDSVRNQEGHHPGLGGVTVDTHIVHQRTGLQSSLHLAEGDILPALELDKILLPVNNLEGAVLLDLTDVPAPEPPVTAYMTAW